MGQKKNPSPLSAPIRHLRSVGCTVRYGHRHSTTGLRPYIHLYIDRPDNGQTDMVARPGHEYAAAVEWMERLFVALAAHRGLDIESSASTQHYIETGEWMTLAETKEWNA